jgi:hypothetical protein
MPVSKRQLAANRRNAQKSTGPRTTAGKEIAARNRVVHGLCSENFTVLTGESQARFDNLLARFMLVEQPADDVELSAQGVWCPLCVV